MSRRGEALDARICALLRSSEEQRGQLQVMQAAMTSLFENMDRFIRGLGSNGRHDGGEQA